MYATNKAVGIMAGSIILNVTTFSITILNYYFKVVMFTTLFLQ